MAGYAGCEGPANRLFVPAAVAAANTVERGTATAQQRGAVGDLESTFDQVEADGFTVTRVAAVIARRGTLRKARDATGRKLVDISPRPS